MVIERGDYPTLTKEVVQSEIVKLGHCLQDLLLQYAKQGGDLARATIVDEVSDGVQAFWVHPPLKSERPACTWKIDASGAACTSGILTRAQ